MHACDRSRPRIAGGEHHGDKLEPQPKNGFHMKRSHSKCSWQSPARPTVCMHAMAAGRALPVASTTVTPLASAALSAATVDGSTRLQLSSSVPSCCGQRFKTSQLLRICSSTKGTAPPPCLVEALSASTVHGSTRLRLSSSLPSYCQNDIQKFINCPVFAQCVRSCSWQRVFHSHQAACQLCRQRHI